MNNKTHSLLSKRVNNDTLFHPVPTKNLERNKEYYRKDGYMIVTDTKTLKEYWGDAYKANTKTDKKSEPKTTEPKDSVN